MKRTPIAIAVVALAATAAWFVNERQRMPPVVVLQAPSLIPSAMTLMTERGNVEPLATTPAIAPAAPRRERLNRLDAAAGFASVSEAYARLSNGTPQERHTAYTLVSQCLDVDKFRAQYGKLYESLRAERCGDLQPGQIASRLEALVPAALAGAHDMHGSAYIDLLTELGGRYGPGQERSDGEALVAESRAAALKAGDWAALAGESQRLLLLGDTRGALVYAFASQHALGLDFPPSIGKVRAFDIEALAKKLSPEVVAQAQIEGNRIGESN